MPKFTAARGDYTFQDAEGVSIHYYVWRAGAPKGVVQIVHGVGEYATRYEDLAQALVTAGYTVYAGDLRGHGQTGLEQHGSDLTKMGKLGPGGVKAMIAGIRQLSGIAHDEHPKLPLVLLGHSLGSLLAQRMLNDDASPYTAVVLSGTAYRTLIHMNGGDLSKRHRPPGGGVGTEWLSRDPDVWTRFDADPLTFDAKVAKLFGVREALGLMGRPTKLSRDLPILILIGEEDPLGGPRSVELLARAYRRQGLSDVVVKIYEDGRHEMFNEINRDEVIADLVAWLDAHLAPAA
ncbi:alpha/beta hydrolase [Pseudolysinimonas sp.]|jgi:alpha-beta hydrolase superfamily lysophospholipase|uniref:alpha/beta hydrolase n=1 Tax=Pseudolysinimonas sp. TaxID=2680009 RepID=UPI0037849313